MRFREIIGFDKVKNQLIQSVENNRVGHSHLFLGPQGSSKLAIAFAFAQYISCTNKSDTDSCGFCNSCTKYQRLIHPDLHLIFPVLLINNIKKAVSDNFIEEFRKIVLKNPYLSLNDWFDVFLEENKTGKTGYIYTQESENLHNKLFLKHYESEYRIIIIWMPEKMQTTTSNKLLKLLEEPPAKTIFLLVSENSDLLLSTIISRVQIRKIKQHTLSQIKKTIKIKDPQKNEEEINKIINLVDGDLGEAISLLETEEFKEDKFSDFQKWMRVCYSSNIKEITRWVNERSKKGRMDQSRFLKYSLKMIRNCLSFHFFQAKFLNITEREKNFLFKFYPFIHEKNIVNITEKVEESIKNIDRNGNKKIILYELSLQLVKLLKVNRKFVV